MKPEKRRNVFANVRHLRRDVSHLGWPRRTF